MDNGSLQKEQALKFKRIVGQNNLKRRKRRTSSFLGTDIVNQKSPRSLAASSNYSSSEEIPLTGSSLDTTISGDWGQLHSWNIDLDICEKDISNGFSQENIVDTEALFDNRDWEHSIWAEDGVFIGQDVIPSEASRISQHSNMIVTPRPTPITSTLPNSQDLDHAVLQEGVHQGAFGASTAEWSLSSYPTPVQSLSANKVLKEPPMLPDDPENSVLRREIEDDLLMRYLDEVFYIQYPFYNFPNKRSRGWLFSSIRCTRSVYYATLALSQRYIQSTTDISSRSRLSNKSNYNEMSLREMESIKGISSSSSDVSDITFVLQILFYEVRHIFVFYHFQCLF